MIPESGHRFPDQIMLALEADMRKRKPPGAWPGGLSLDASL
jgi:hypothetical protein